MRTGLLSLLLLLLVGLCSNLNAQEYVLKVRKKEKESDFYPHIAGVMDGDILIETACGSEISNNKNWKVVSFVITYGFRQDENPLRILGNRIPQNLCNGWKSVDYKGLPLFITEIKAQDKEGNVYHLNNLKLILK